MNYTKKTLPNGLRVITVPMKDSTTVAVLVMVEAGSKYETKDVHGVAHFLEHMCFKGTANRPRSIDIARELDSIGAEYNAFTGQEYTGYYAKSHPKHFGKILDIISDIYLNPVLDEKEIEREKGVIIEEINMYEDTPMELIDDVFNDLLYGDQPAGRPTLGTKESVQLLKRDAIINYRTKHYVAPATVVIVAGNIDENQAIEEVSRTFAAIGGGAKASKEAVRDEQAAPQIALKYKESDQTHIMLGVRSYPTRDDRNYALSVLNSILGGGMSARLWQKIREDLGVAYYVYSSIRMRTDHGYFFVSAGVDNNRVLEVVSAVMDELKKLKKDGITEEELKNAKDYLLGKMYLRLETSDELAEYYGLQETMQGKTLRPEEVADKIRAVTVSDVNACAQDLLKDETLNLAMIGRQTDRDSLMDLLTFKKAGIRTS